MDPRRYREFDPHGTPPYYDNAQYNPASSPPPQSTRRYNESTSGWPALTDPASQQFRTGRGSQAQPEQYGVPSYGACLTPIDPQLQQYGDWQNGSMINLSASQLTPNPLHDHTYNHTGYPLQPYPLWISRQGPPHEPLAMQQAQSLSFGTGVQMLGFDPRSYHPHPRVGAVPFPSRRRTILNSRNLHLYGSGRPAVQVVGQEEAVSKLQKAVSAGLAVRQQIYTSDREVLHASLEHHQANGSWPADLKDFALDHMNQAEREALGMSAADFRIRSTSSIVDKGEPLYRTRDIDLDSILAMQRMMSKYHDNDSPDGPRVWALGIVTKLSNSTFTAKLFRAEDRPSTHELWMLREVVGNPRADFIEVWRPFCLQPGAPFRREKFARPTLRHPNQTSSHHPQQSRSTPDVETRKTKARNVHKYNHATARWSEYSHLSWTEILDQGRIPLEDFCGEVLLEVAKYYSNSEIASRTNAWRAQPTSDNMICQNIKKAIQLKAGTPGWPATRGEATKFYEGVRVRNGGKMESRAGRASRIGMKPARREAFEDGDDGEAHDWAGSGSPMAADAMRRMRKRSFVDDEEDDEEDFRPVKRSRQSLLRKTKMATTKSPNNFDISAEEQMYPTGVETLQTQDSFALLDEEDDGTDGEEEGSEYGQSNAGEEEDDEEWDGE